MNVMLELLFTLTIAGSVASAAILLLRLVRAERFPAFWRYKLGKMAIVFYLLPVTITLPRISVISTLSEGSALLRDKAGLQMPNPLSLSNFLSITAKPILTVPKNAVIVLLALWAAGALLFAAWQLYGYIRFTVVLRRSQSAVAANSEATERLAAVKADLGITSKVALASSPLLQSPMLVGFFNPTIYLPAASIDGLDWDMVIRHELIHLKRKDIWVKAASLGISALHWFNPLVHLLRQDLATWSELSCDEAVVKKMSRSERLRYGQTILNVSAGNQLLARRLPVQFGASLSGDGKKLKRRLNAMLHVKKHSKKTMILLLSTVMMVAAVSIIAAIWASSVTPAVADLGTGDPLKLTGLGEKDDNESNRDSSATLKHNTDITSVNDANANAIKDTTTSPDTNTNATNHQGPVSEPNTILPEPSSSPSAAEPIINEIAPSDDTMLVAEGSNSTIAAESPQPIIVPAPLPSESGKISENKLNVMEDSIRPSVE